MLQLDGIEKPDSGGTRALKGASVNDCIRNLPPREKLLDHIGAQADPQKQE